jgi:hypothetical protein
VAAQRWNKHSLIAFLLILAAAITVVFTLASLVHVAVKPQLPANFEADTWAKLQAAVQAVHQKQPVATSLEELYRVSASSSSSSDRRL